MADIEAAIDETAATDLLHAGEAMLGSPSASGSSSLGPFSAGYSVAVSVSGGSATLSPPNVLHLVSCSVHYSLNLSFSVDLSKILPNLCLPQVCFPIPFDGQICTPQICITWPTISIPLSYSDTVVFSADFAINVINTPTTFAVSATVLGIPALNLSASANALLIAIGAAIAAAVLVVPFIGPILALAVGAVVALISLANVTGLLGALISPLVAGLTIPLLPARSKTLQVLPAAGGDPAVDLILDTLSASVQSTDKNELVVTIDI